MSILIDSADIEQVRQAMDLGFVSGVTTNPSLMAQTKGAAEDTIAAILDASRGPVFYQETGENLEQCQEGDNDLDPGACVG